MNQAGEQQLGQPYPSTSITEESKTKDRILLESTILFAQRGYNAVSMRDIAGQVGIKPASLYNHFESKETLWAAIMDHTEKLYLLYFQRLDEAYKSTSTFEEILDAMFLELKSVVDIFTYYSFSLVQAEQFRDPIAARICNEVFLDYSIGKISEKYDECVQKKKTPPFDTRAVATFFMHSVLMGINARVHEHMGNGKPYDATAMFTALQKTIYNAVMAEK